MQQRHTDETLARLAVQRRGIVVYSELVAAGLSKRQILYRLRTGHLIRLHRGVYAVGHAYLSPLARGEAAALAAGPRSLLTHRFCLALHSVLPFPQAIDVTVPRGGPRPPGLAIHQPRTLPPWIIRHGLRTTLVPQALLDLATVADRQELTVAVNQSYVHRLVTTEQLDRLIDGGHRGCIALARVVNGPRTRSGLEMRFVGLLETARLPAAETNVMVNGHLVDFCWRGARVIGETDGWGPHGGYGAFNSDRSRDLDHTAAGWRPIRITARHVSHESHALTARLGRLLL